MEVCGEKKFGLEDCLNDQKISLSQNGQISHLSIYLHQCPSLTNHSRNWSYDIKLDAPS